MPRRTDRKKHKYLGEASHGAGNRKNRRGKGSKGGRGRAGFHKHRWLHKLKVEGPLAPKGFAPINPSGESITLRTIAHGIVNGEWEGKTGAYEITLGKTMKVIGAGKFAYKANVTAGGFSEGAKKAIEAAGGTAKTIA